MLDKNAVGKGKEKEKKKENNSIASTGQVSQE
jgi:hypothetical protein